MAMLTNLGTFGGELPTLQCSECDMRFSIVWDRNPIYDKPEYCPFCGDEIEAINWEEPEE